jgi:hypothetical protein
MRDYRGGEHKNLPYSFNVAPTKPQLQVDFGFDGYRRK